MIPHLSCPHEEYWIYDDQKCPSIGQLVDIIIKKEYDGNNGNWRRLRSSLERKRDKNMHRFFSWTSRRLYNPHPAQDRIGLGRPLFLFNLWSRCTSSTKSYTLHLLPCKYNYWPMRFPLVFWQVVISFLQRWAIYFFLFWNTL